VAQGSFGAPDAERIAYMRYVGQGHIPVPLPSRPLGEEDALIRAAYDAEYTRFYDRLVPGSTSDHELRLLVATVPEDDPGTPVAGDDAVFVPDDAGSHAVVRDTTTGEVRHGRP
jgi:N-methylhydantoinase A